MKAVLACIVAGALAAQLLTGCAGTSLPEVKDARVVLAQAVVYAQDAAAVTKTICEIDFDGKPCQYMLKLLDEAFTRGAQIEAALNAGQDMAAEVERLEEQLRALLGQAQALLKGIV